ncbi:MAG: hypothetical protein ACLQMF_08265 [Rectinemataceae bacterium]
MRRHDVCFSATIIAVFLVLFFVPESSHAVPFADRTIVVDPFDSPIEGEGGFLQRSSGWGEFSNYLASSDGEHTWNAKLGASVEIFRLRNLWSVDIGSDVELVASPNDDIHFKPRVFYWQESLFVMRQYDFIDLGIGYYHRCRHDIDNIAEQAMFGQDLERVCIYDSVTLRAYPKPFTWGWGKGEEGSARFTLDEHAYVLRQDSMSAQSSQPLTLNGLLDTVALGLETEPFRYGRVGWYFNLKEYTDFYNAEGGIVLSADLLAETGFGFHGNGGEFVVFLRFEHFAETLMDPWRQEGDYLSLGLRLE